MSGIKYGEAPEFQKDFKRLLKRFPSLEKDLSLAKAAAIELFHVRNINNFSVFPVQGFHSGGVGIYKMKKFACKALKGRGAKSGIRIMYAFNASAMQVDFIQMYFKGDQENEDRDRIKAYLKSWIRMNPSK